MVLMTVRTGGRQHVFFAAGWGLLLDCLGEGRMGVNLVALTLAALAVQSFQAQWPLNSLWRAGVVAAIVVGIEFGVSTVLLILAAGLGPDLRMIVTHAAGSALYSGIVIAVLLRASQMVLRQPSLTAGGIVPTVSNNWRMLTEA
jgi:rod shape-determining protein MreD